MLSEAADGEEARLECAGEERADILDSRGEIRKLL
jgi:hypothetical protein